MVILNLRVSPISACIESTQGFSQLIPSHIVLLTFIGYVSVNPVGYSDPGRTPLTLMSG